jgi:hypothetical protein
MTGESAARRAEDIGGQELSYAEVKAIASGNPAVLTLAEADAELSRLAILRKNHADEQYLARRSIRELPETIARLEKRVAGLTADGRTLAAHDGDDMVIGGHAIAAEDAVKALGKRLNSIPAEVHETRRFPVGMYRGLDFGIALHRFGNPEVYLEGEATRHGPLSRDAGPRAVLNALDRLASSYGSQRDTARQDLAIAEGQLRDHQARLGKPFAHEAYLSELTDLRDRLKAGLSQAAEPGAETVPVPELAERIKGLKAAHDVEAAPERTAARRIAAEQPVTARIRRHLAEPPASGATGEPEADPAAAIAGPFQDAVPAADPDEPVPATTGLPIPAEALAVPPPAPRPKPGYRQRVERGRRQEARQLSLF